jgi:hypothetical protein
MVHSNNKVLFIKNHCKAILKCRRQSRSSLRWPVSQQYFWTIKTIMKMAPRNQTPPQNPRTPPEKGNNLTPNVGEIYCDRYKYM